MRLFGLLILLFLVHQLTQYLHFNNELLDAYLDPFLFFPLVMYAAKRWNRFYNRSYKVSWPLAFLSYIWMAVLFEVIFPQLSPRFEGDVFDLIAYALGLLLFMYKMNGED